MPVDWKKPLEWSDGTPIIQVVELSGSWMDYHVYPGRPGTGWEYSGAYANGTTGADLFVRNAKVKEEVAYNESRFRHMEDQDLADELKEAEAQLEAISEELMNREYEIDGGRYDVPNAQSITKTIELEINCRR